MPLIHKPRSQKQKHPVWGVFYFWWEWLDCNSHIRCRSMGPFRLRLEPGGSHLTTHSQKQKPTIRSVCVFGGSGWIRTSSGLSQQIYSLPRLSNSGARPISPSPASGCAIRSLGEVWCGQRETERKRTQ